MIPDKVASIMRSLLNNGHEAYIIGGAVRDAMLCREPTDWDVFTNASGEEMLSIFPHGKVIGNGERQKKILTVVEDGVEVSQYRANGDRTETGASLEQHLATCDFTMNALAMDIDGGITDNHFGAIDLQHKEIACVGDPRDRIEEDKLRAPRAIRFAVKYNFSIEKRLSHVIFDTDISNLPIERVREEMLKIIMHPGALSMLDQSNLMGKIVPEFEASVLMDGGRHHAETVDDHLCNAQNAACALTDNPALVFACAFHDIGKPATREDKAGGGVSFHNHETVGAEMIHDIMSRLRFSNADIGYVETLVAEHMFGPWSDEISDRSFIKHFKRLEDADVSIEDYMVLLYSDNQANLKNPQVKFGDFVRDNRLHKKYYELRFSNAPFGVRDLAINGRDLLDVGVPAGVGIGDALNGIFGEVINGNLENERHILMRHIKRIRDGATT